MIGLLFACYAIAISDGDTFRCDDGTRIRVFGINTVERGEPGYREAGANLRSLVLNRRLVCEVKGYSSDRIVALCRREDDGLDLGQAQVASGYASDCAAYSKGRYRPFELPGRPAPASFCIPE